MNRVDDPQYQDRTGQFSQVRFNMLTRKDYAPYCGACSTMHRMRFNGQQMKCIACGIETNFDPEFIEHYKAAQANLSKT